MQNKIKSFEEVCKLVKKHQEGGDRVVLCHGFFDVLHAGHVTLLNEAKKLGSVLVVGVDHDENGGLFKSIQRPLFDQRSRMFVISGLSVVDLVFLIPSFKKVASINDYIYNNIYSPLRPNVIVTNVKCDRFAKDKKKRAIKLGAEFVDIDHGINQVSSTKIIEYFGLE